MMAGSITLDTYDTFNYFAAQAGKKTTATLTSNGASGNRQYFSAVSAYLGDLCVKVYFHAEMYQLVS